MKCISYHNGGVETIIGTIYKQKRGYEMRLRRQVSHTKCDILHMSADIGEFAPGCGQAYLINSSYVYYSS